jgi:hypothetical protein
MAKRYATPDYFWAVRDELEKKNFGSVKELATEYFKLRGEAHKDAISALQIGLFYSLTKRIDNTIGNPFIFENDTDFQNLRKQGIDNCNKTKEFENYFKTLGQ